jgi:hypothetical protein
MEARAAFDKSPQCAELRTLIAPFPKGGSMERFQMDARPRGFVGP